MKINVKAIPNSKRYSLIKENNLFKVHLPAQAINNKFNLALIKYLSEYFCINKKAVKIIKGERSRDKIVEICKN